MTRAEQDAEYLAPTRPIIVDAVRKALMSSHPDDLVVADAVLDALADAGWHLLTYEDAEAMLNAYVMQKLR